MKKNNLLDHLKNLVYIPSVASNEIGVREYILKNIDPKNKKISIDIRGNLIISIGKNYKKLAIVAHMDKEGFLVSQNKNQYLQVIRGYKTNVLPKGIISEVVVINSKGISTKAILKNMKSKYNDLRVYGKNLASYEIGDYVSYISPFIEKNSLVTTAHLDNSIGVAIAIELVNTIDEGTIIFSALESIGFQGVGFAVKQLLPTKVIVLDTTYETHEKVQGTPLFVGKGPTICIKDLIFEDKQIIKDLKKIAKKKHIPYQMEIWDQATSDVLAIQQLNEPIAIGFVGLPIRNHGTPKEIGSLHDMEHAYQLLNNYFKIL